LLWLHIALALLVCFIFLSKLDWRDFPYWRRRADIVTVMRGFAPTLPYVISALVSRAFVGPKRLAVWLFIAILLAGTATVSYLYMTGSGPYSVAMIIVLQTTTYLIAALLLLRGTVAG
jgi:hypothetical protein